MPITVPGTGSFETFDEAATVNNITNGLDAALGLDWPAIPGVTGNDVSVRIVADGNNLTELTARDTFNGGGGTQWAFPLIYVNPANYFQGFKVVTSTAPVGTYRLFSDVLIEITFQGEWHDWRHYWASAIYRCRTGCSLPRRPWPMDP